MNAPLCECACQKCRVFFFLNYLLWKCHFPLYLKSATSVLALPWPPFALFIPSETGVLIRSLRRWLARCRMGQSSNGSTRHAAGRRDVQEAGEDRGPNHWNSASEIKDLKRGTCCGWTISVIWCPLLLLHFTTVEFSPLLASPFLIHTMIKSFWLELPFQSNDDWEEEFVICLFIPSAPNLPVCATQCYFSGGVTTVERASLNAPTSCHANSSLWEVFKTSQMLVRRSRFMQ